MSRGREKGFTLVELMIVVVIIGILASIAIPKFASIVGKAKMSEAKTMLNEVITIETAYFFQEQVFRDFDDEDVPEIGWKRPTNARFLYKFATDAGDATKGIATATEIGDVDGNDVTDTDGLTLDTDKNRGNLTPDMAW